MNQSFSNVDEGEPLVNFIHDEAVALALMSH